MDGHEAGGVKDPVAALIDVLEGIEELQAVRGVPEDRLFFVAAEGDVVHPL